MTEKQAAKQAKKLLAAAAMAQARGDYAEAHELRSQARELKLESQRQAAA